MMRTCCCLAFLLVALPAMLHAQSGMKGQVYDGRTKNPLPFATVKFGESGHGTVANLDGIFDVPAKDLAGVGYVEVSCLGYKSQKITLPAKDPVIYLEPEDKYLGEVVIKPPKDKIRRILNSAIDNKKRNNPDKYDWYRCHVYYKMLADMTLSDSMLKDTGSNRELADFLSNQHLLLSETYSIRTWKKPQHLQEDVIGTRLSGLKKSPFTSLVTDELPFHAYTDYLTLNGKDYHNPVSRGFEQYYKFNLVDELIQGEDTVWALSFRPRGHNANELTGTVYINSDGYAISHIIARAYDTILSLHVRIEQEYSQVPVSDSESKWFPKHLNYIIDYTLKSKKGSNKALVLIKGTSTIDSVTFKENEGFRFDKAHTVRLYPGANELSDSAWNVTRPEPLDKKEARTYKVIDSLGEEIHADRIVDYTSRLPDAKVPVWYFDLDLKRLFSYNQYEHTRLGLGLQTNDRVAKWVSVGGWGGYGFRDGHWKYGAFTEFYFDRTKEFVLRASYTDDIADPGRIHLSPELDKYYLNYYLLQRVDVVKTAALSLRKRLGYWNAELAGRQQQITPMYAYALSYEGERLQTFTATEATLSLRYAYAERTAPLFGRYYSIGSRYPVWYGKLTTGSLGSPQDARVQIPYTQAVTAVAWLKHINRVGSEHIFAEAGKSWSSATLPLSKLFAGSGFAYGGTGGFSESLYTFGGMMTMFPYQYYSDRFVNVIYRHDFDWKLYKVNFSGTAWSSAPNICLQYGMLYGTLAHPELQNLASFSVPDHPYNEGGLILNNLLRFNYLNLYYFTFNIGYFYHIAPIDFKHADENGRITLGAAVEF